MSEGVTAATRIAISAVVDRLIHGSPDDFNRSDAIELRRLLPPGLRVGFLASLLPSVTARGSFPGGATVGAAAGVGNVRLPDRPMSFDLDSRGRRIIRAGQWKIALIHSDIEIVQVMADSDEGRSARLRFKAGEPVGMDILTEGSVGFGPFRLAVGSFRPWKVVASE